MHQNRIWLTLKSSLCGTFVLLLLVSTTASGLGSVVSRMYRYNNLHYTWQAAQNHCRSIDNRTDLATIYTKSNADGINLKNYSAWIGLVKQNGNWMWQLGSFLDPRWWSLDLPQNNENCAVARYNNDRQHCCKRDDESPVESGTPSPQDGPKALAPLTYLVYGVHCDTHLFFICGYTYKVITQSKTWSEAQDYCRNNLYIGLASFLDRKFMKSVVDDQDFPVWIGLYRNGQKWEWTAGLSNYTNWAAGEPRNDGNCVSISSLKKEMATQDCSTRLPFICYKDNLVLIKKSKTWNEALEHCRALRSPTNQKLRYELVSIHPNDHDYVKNKLAEANVEEVWTGLRFLAGEWLWVNGADMMYSDLPLCPPVVQHCGALSKSGTGSMVTRDCTERKNFMCYWTV